MQLGEKFAKFKGVRYSITLTHYQKVLEEVNIEVSGGLNKLQQKKDLFRKDFPFKSKAKKVTSQS